MMTIVTIGVLWGLLPFAAIVLGVLLDMLNHPYK